MLAQSTPDHATGPRHTTESNSRGRSSPQWCTREDFPNLLKRHEPILRRLASTFLRPGLDLEDLVQESRIALWRASQRFDPRRDTPFPAYAKRVILNALKRYQGRMLPHQANQEEGLSEFDLDRLRARRSTLRLQIREDSGIVRDALRRLPERMNDVFNLLYKEGHSQREAADLLGISQPRVSHLNHRLISLTATQLKTPSALALRSAHDPVGRTQ